MDLEARAGHRHQRAAGQNPAAAASPGPRCQPGWRRPFLQVGALDTAGDGGGARAPEVLDARKRGFALGAVGPGLPTPPPPPPAPQGQVLGVPRHSLSGSPALRPRILLCAPPARPTPSAPAPPEPPQRPAPPTRPGESSYSSISHVIYNNHPDSSASPRNGRAKPPPPPQRSKPCSRLRGSWRTPGSGRGCTPSAQLPEALRKQVLRFPATHPHCSWGRLREWGQVEGQVEERAGWGDFKEMRADKRASTSLPGGPYANISGYGTAWGSDLCHTLVWVLVCKVGMKVRDIWPLLLPLPSPLGDPVCESDSSPHSSLFMAANICLPESPGRSREEWRGEMWAYIPVGKGEDLYPSGRPGMLLRGGPGFARIKCSAFRLSTPSQPPPPSRVVPALRLLITHSVPPPSTPPPVSLRTLAVTPSQELAEESLSEIPLLTFSAHGRGRSAEQKLVDRASSVKLVLEWVRASSLGQVAAGPHQDTVFLGGWGGIFVQEFPVVRSGSFTVPLRQD